MAIPAWARGGVGWASTHPAPRLLMSVQAGMCKKATCVAQKLPSTFMVSLKPKNSEVLEVKTHIGTDYGIDKIR